MDKSTKLAGIMALAVAGALTAGYYAEEDVPIDKATSSQPASRNQYLVEQFPSLRQKLKEISVNLAQPDKVWKEGRNEWHALYKLGSCSKLPENWSQALANSMGKGDIWGTVKNATTDAPITVRVKSHPEFVHILMTEFNPSKFAEKPWHKSWMKSPSDIKSSYILALVCESHINKDRAP